jgi:hypothetical protein
MMAIRLLPIALLLLPLDAAAKRPQMVAVMTLQDLTRNLSSRLVDSLTDALRGQLAQRGRFVVIDKSRQAKELARLISEQKKESYKECYSSSCQIPLGQALAADSILRTKLTRVGSYYLLIAELVDLAKEAVIGAAQVRVYVRPAAGRDDRLLGAVSSVARQLSVGSSRHHRSGPSAGGQRARREREERRRRALAERRQLREHARLERRRRTEEMRRQRRIEAGRAELVRSRRTRLVYGWMAIISGAILGGVGAYYITAKVSADEETAANATSPGELQTAADDASKHRVAGIVFGSLGAAALGAGAYLVLSAPRVPPVKVAGEIELDRLPSGGPSPGGWTFSWGGRF